MPQTVHLPSGKTVHFPDTMTPEQIRSAVVKLHMQDQSDQNQPQPKALTMPGQTTIGADDPTVAAVRRYAGAIPGLGAMAGSIIGTRGGAPGEVVGGAVGGASGDVLRQLIQNPQAGAEIDPGSVFQEGAAGGAAGALGAATSRGLPTLFKRKLNPEQAKDVAILERENIPYTAGDIRPGGALQQTENLMRGTLFGGRVMEQSTTRQAAALNQFREKVLNNIGPLLSKEETGKAIQEAVEGRTEQLFNAGGVFDRAYQRVGALFPAKIDTASIRQQMQPIKAELDALLAEGRIPAAKSGETPQRFASLVENLNSYGTKQVPAQPASTVLNQFGQPAIPASPAGTAPVPLTYRDVWQDKQTIDAIIRSMSHDDPLRTRAKALLNRIHGILDGAMEQSARQVDPQAAEMIRKVNAGYAKAKELYQRESLVSDIPNMDPERIVDRFFPKGATTAPKELANALSANREVLPVVRRRAVENLLEPLTKEREGVPVVVGRSLEPRFKAMLPTLKKVLEPDQISGIQEFIDASKRAQSSGAMTNPASGRQILAASQLMTLGAGGLAVATGDTSTAAGAAALVFTPAVLAKALTNPSIARFLAQGLTLKRGTAEAGRWSILAANVLRSLTQNEGQANAE